VTYGTFRNSPAEPPSHTFDELRQAAIEVLRRPSPPNSYGVLLEAIAAYFAQSEPSSRPQTGLPFAQYPTGPMLSRADRDLMLEVFWDLFRCGVIIFGLNDANRGFEWFRVSKHGSGEKIV
jgi:hypothetical protein